MSRSAPKPFSSLTKKEESKATEKTSSSVAFPPMSAAASTPFGAFSNNEESKATQKTSSGAAFPPISAAASKNLFSTKSSSGRVFPPMPMAAAAPKSFGAFSQKEDSKATEKTSSSAGFPPMFTESLSYHAPLVLTTGIPPNSLTMPPASCDMSENCVICHEQLLINPSVALTHCVHVFHKCCIEQAMKAKPQCPVCRIPVGAPQGKSPSGTMKVSIISTSCFGFQESSSLAISYNITSGNQMSYHENPALSHAGKYVMAYLPNNSGGGDLLKRLAYAFMHGLTFSVGTSVTTGKKNQCTWASIHHKTSTHGGVRKHGYPDPNYVVNCNSELDSLRVPPAHALNYNGTECNHG
mmetsp:Transcript_16703/g.36101  ORF Transcript_16703/g.36101 Transcript_16703/m.36101 type:complete len:353 (-) Transcript_16703:938-1996(-)